LPSEDTSSDRQQPAGWVVDTGVDRVWGTAESCWVDTGVDRALGTASDTALGSLEPVKGARVDSSGVDTVWDRNWGRWTTDSREK